METIKLNVKTKTKNYPIYFGDNITPGGNDFEIAEMISKNGGIYYNVNGYRETWNILKEVI